MSAELRIPLWSPPGFGLLSRTVRGAWTQGGELVTASLAMAKALPSIALSMQRLADLQDELEALGELDLQLERLADLQDELAQLGRLEHALDRIAEFGTPLDNLTEPVADLAVAARSLPELAVAARSLPELVEQVKRVEAIVANMDVRLDGLTPMLNEIADFGQELGGDIDDLGEALAPISRIASRLPGSGSRRRRREIAAGTDDAD